MKVTVTRDDGTQYDITEQIRYAYDIVVSSLDWGSGMLDVEEVEQISALGYVCGFQIDLSDRAGVVWRLRREQDPNIKRWEAARKEVTDAEREQIIARLMTKVTHV